MTRERSGQGLTLLFAGDLADRVLDVANRGLSPSLVLFFSALSRSLGIAKRLADLFLDRPSDFFHTSGNAVLVHSGFLSNDNSYFKRLHRPSGSDNKFVSAEPNRSERFRRYVVYYAVAGSHPNRAERTIWTSIGFAIM